MVRWFIITLIVDTLLQLYFIGFNLAFLLNIIARICFLLRLIDTHINVVILYVLESLGFIFYVVICSFLKYQINWVCIIFCLIASLLYFIDERYFVYYKVENMTKEEEEAIRNRK